MTDKHSLDQLLAQMGSWASDTASAPRMPVEQWNPALSGNIDITIDREGQWWHEGSLIVREKLSNLFASILKKEGAEYFLVTPVEKWRIQVEDAPLVIVDYKVQQLEGHQTLVLKTRNGDLLRLSASHPLRMSEGKPYVLVRANLEALVHRNVFYQWQELLCEQNGVHGIMSAGQFWPLEEQQQ